jgi:hypothetical protein
MKRYWVNDVVTDAASNKVSWQKVLEAVQIVHASSLVRPKLRWPASVALIDRPKRAIICAKGFMNLLLRPLMVPVLGLLAFAAWHLNLPTAVGVLVIACFGYSYVMAAWERAVIEFGMFAQVRPFLDVPAAPDEARRWYETMKAWFECNHMAGPGKWTLAWGRRMTKAFRAVHKAVSRRACDGPLEMPEVSALSPEEQVAARQVALLVEELPPEPDEYRRYRLVGPESVVGHTFLAVGVILIATALAHEANPNEAPDVLKYVRATAECLAPPPEQTDEDTESASEVRPAPAPVEPRHGQANVNKIESTDADSTPRHAPVQNYVDLRAPATGRAVESAFPADTEQSGLPDRRKLPEVRQ